jgi:hypothetical protein
MVKRKTAQRGDGFIEDAYDSAKAWVKDNHILSGIGSAVTPMLAAWNPVAGTASAAAAAALRQNGWGQDKNYYRTHKFGQAVSGSYGAVKFKTPRRR